MIFQKKTAVDADEVNVNAYDGWPRSVTRVVAFAIFFQTTSKIFDPFEDSFGEEGKEQRDKI